MRARLVALLIGLVVAASPAAAAQSPAPPASLPDIEDEVMCVECETALNVSTAPAADQEREFIAELIAEGRTKEQVKAALVDEYGPGVLAQPGDDGFELAAWLVPLLGGAGALLLVVVTARRWRRAPAAAPGTRGAPGMDPDDARRLDAELAAFDR